MRQVLPVLPNYFNISYCSPTQDIKDSYTLKKYLKRRASYTVIPGIQDSYAFNPFSIISQILPYSENQVFDICLPYFQMTAKKVVIKHMARYIICDKKLYGIKIKPSENWPIQKTQKIALPEELQIVYSKFGFNLDEKILLGQFYILTKNFKIAPLFESQISFIEGEKTVKAISEYYDVGCEIYSIVNDLTEERKKNLTNPIQFVKKFRKQNIIVVYCGSTLVQNKDTSYRTNSFSTQNNQFSRIDIDKFDEINSSYLVINMNDIRSKKRPHRQRITNNIEKLDCSKGKIQRSFIEQSTFNTFGEVIQEQMSLTLDQKKQLYLWYLYNNINRRNQFILPYPLDSHSANIIQTVQSLCEKLNMQPNQMIKLLNTQKPSLKMRKLPKQHESYQIIQQISKLSILKLLYLYFQADKTNIKTQIQSRSNIFNCAECIPTSLFDNIEEPNNGMDEQVVHNEEVKFVQKFLRKKNPSIQQLYSEMLTYFTKGKLNQDLLQRLYAQLKKQMRLSVKVSPFYSYVMMTSFSQVKQIFKKSQEKNVQTTQRIKHQQNGEGEEQIEFRQFLHKIKYHSNNQKKTHYNCHICNSMFAKKDRSSYGKKCLACSNFICFGCYDEKTGNNAQSLQAFSTCLVCSNKCDCKECRRKKAPSQVSKPENSIFMGNGNDDFLSRRKDNSTVLKSDKPNETTQFQKTFMSQKPSINNISKYEPIQQQPKQNDIKLSNIQPIKSCQVCCIYQRNEKNITFECSSCKNIKCLGCQKADSSKRSWKLRGKILCNQCNDQQTKKVNTQMTLNQMIGRLQNEVMQLKRQRFMKHSFNKSTLPTDNLASMNQPIFEQNYQNQSNNEQQHQTQLNFANSPQRSESDKGGATPLFIKNDNGQGRNSPGRRDENQLFANSRIRKNSGSNSSASSKPIERKQRKNRDQQFSPKQKKKQQRKRSHSFGNSSNSSAKSEKRQNKKMTNNRKENNRDDRSVSSKGSPPRNNTKKDRKQSMSSVQSGQYRGSDSPSEPINHRNGNKWGDRQNNDNFRGGDRNRGQWRGNRGGNRGQGDRGGRGRGGFRNDDSNNDRGGFRDNNRGQRRGRGGFRGNDRDNDRDRGGGYRGNDRGGRFNDDRQNNDRGGRGFDRQDRGGSRFNSDRQQRNQSGYQRSDQNNDNQGKIFNNSKSPVIDDDPIDQY